MNRTMGLLAAIALALAPAGDALAAESAKAVFKDAKGQQIGRAVLTETPQGVLIEAELSGLPRGEHAFHIHDKGQCDAADGFKSAGEHHSPKNAAHGRVAGGPHEGDMANQTVGDDGKLRIREYNPRVSLGQGDGTLFDRDGSALVLHAKPDDHRSQPAGDAGDRIACAIIERGDR